MDTPLVDARWRGRLGNAFLLVLFALLLGRTLSRAEPLHNWDMLGYMALALEWSEDDPVEVHRRTYTAARDELPREVFAGLIAPGVRRGRFDDPQAFTSHLAFYRARVLFTLLTAMVHAGGVPLSSAPWFVSLGSLAGLALLALVWAARYVPLPLAVLLALGLAHAPPLLTTATFASADGLANLITCGGLMACVGRRRTLGAVLLTAAILVRPDSVILVGVLALAFHFLEREEQRPSLRFLGLWVGGSALVYVGVQSFADAFSWWIVLYISFVEKALHPGQVDASFDAGMYAAILRAKLAELPGTGYIGNQRSVTGSTFVFLFSALGVFGLGLWRRLRASGLGSGSQDRRAAVLAGLLVTFGVRWFLFPQLWDRFFAVLYVAVPLVLLGMVVEALERGRAVRA